MSCIRWRRRGSGLPAVSAADPRTIFTYNADEDLVRVDRPDGKAVDLGYHGAGRLETVTTPRGTTTQSYDPATGNLATITAPGGEQLDFAYDGSLVTDTTWTGTVSGTVSRTYDDDFRVASQTVAGSGTASFAYDADSLLTQAGALTLNRDPQNGLLTGTTLDTVTTSRSYNAFGELASDAAAASGGALYSNTYTRDAVGRIVEETETIQGETTVFEYAYDAAGRLVEVREDGTVTEAYSYDANGNRLARTTPKGTEAGTYDDQDRLQSFGEFTYTQNAAGDRTSKTNATSGETTQYEYDALGNLTQVTLPDGRTVEYAIDGRNRRVGKKVDGSLVQGFLYQDQLNPVAELDGAGNVEARFVYGVRPNVPAYMIKDGTLYRLVADHLGSVRLVVNTATGAVAQRLDYDAFGRVTQDTNPGFQPFGFAGGLYDADTGLVRFGARDYDPEVGRWTAKDSIGFLGGQSNLYGYALGDPLNVADSTGLAFYFVGGRASLILGVGGEVGRGFYIGFHEGESQGEGLFGTNFAIGFYASHGAGAGFEASLSAEAGRAEELSGVALNINAGVPSRIPGASLIIDPSPCGNELFGEFLMGATGSIGFGGGLSSTFTHTFTLTDVYRSIFGSGDDGVD